MTFTQLRTFALVAELGSLRAAAAALGVSEPAVSAAVAALRTDLGDPLFRRTGTGIALTPGGRALAAPGPGAGPAGRPDPAGGRARDVGRPAARAGDGGLRRARRRRGGRRVHPPGAAGRRRPDRRARPTARRSPWPRTTPTSCSGSGRRRAAGPAGRVGAVPALRSAWSWPPRPPAGRAARLRPADLAGHRWLTGPGGHRGRAARRSAGPTAPGCRRTSSECDSEAAALDRRPRRRRACCSRSRHAVRGRPPRAAPWSGCRSRARR